MIKKFPWTKDDDKYLIEAYKLYGYKSWDKISEYLLENYKINRKAYQCRERYNFHLKSNNKFTWDLDKYKLLIKSQKEFGNKWVKIKKNFININESALKNKFNGILRKSLRRTNKLFGKKENISIIQKFKPKILTKFYNLNNLDINNIKETERKYINDSIKFSSLVNLFLDINNNKNVTLNIEDELSYKDLIPNIIEFNNINENINNQISSPKNTIVNSIESDKFSYYISKKNNNLNFTNSPCNFLNLTISRIIIS